MRLPTGRSSDKTKRAFTLAEILVSLAVMSLVLLALNTVLRSAIGYYQRSTEATEVQQNCVVAMSRLVSELLESSPLSVRGDPVNHACVTFGSPRSDTGEFHFGVDPLDNRNKLVWERLIGCYVAPSKGGNTGLFRKEKKLGSPEFAAPKIGDEYVSQYWIDRASPAKLLAERVYYLDVEPSTTVKVILGVRNTNGDFRVSIETKLKPRN